MSLEADRAKVEAWQARAAAAADRAENAGHAIADSPSSTYVNDLALVSIALSLSVIAGVLTESLEDETR